MSIKDKKIDELTLQLEELRLMPEGVLLGDGSGRRMKERRRKRYVEEAKMNIRVASRLPEGWFVCRENENLLFSDNLIEDNKRELKS